MMRRVRRLQPFVAALAIVIAPGTGGAWLPLLHPCPVDAPWASGHGADGVAADQAHAHHGAHHADHGAHDQPPAGDAPAAPVGHGEGHDCHCVGSCDALAVVRPPAATRWAVVPPVVVAQRLRPSAALPHPVVEPADLLHYSTAPPRA